MRDNAGEPKIVVLLVSSDLIFSTKITGTARALGLEIEVIGSGESAASRIPAALPRCVLLDLGLASLSTEHMRAIVGAAAGAPVLAFGSHVDTARLQQAADAGCTEVMPRSRLAAALPQLLQQYCHG